MSKRGAPAAARIPVLLYHPVMEDPPEWIAEFSVTPKDFAAQLDAILDSGRTPVTISTLVGHLTTGAPMPERPVLITFDDGFADLAGPTAETLAERSVVSTAYLTTGAITPGRRHLLPPAPMMTLSQVPLLEQYGMEIGTHTITHAQLDTLGTAALDEELREPKEVLEQLLGHEVAHLAYPHGYNSRKVRKAALRAGYSSAVAVRHALSSQTDELYRIARLIVRRTHTVADIEAWMEGRGAKVAPYPDSLPTVGWRWYRRAQAAVKGPRFAG
jgi:peptidoglycan/xylan/chitin deacetylase (PgdA/CDA1 family)